MNENIIAWNFTNMVTVTLIVLVSFFAISVAQKLYQGNKDGNGQVSSQ